MPLLIVPGASQAAPTSPPSQLEESLAAPEDPTPNAPDDFTIFQNNTLAPGSSSEVNEPSVAQADNVVFYTGNWYAAVSTDHGVNFNFIDPTTAPSRR